jgi:hypothetical protein
MPAMPSTRRSRGSGGRPCRRPRKTLPGLAALVALFVIGAVGIPATQAGADPPQPPHGDGVHPGGGNDQLDNSAHTLHPNPAPQPPQPPDTPAPEVTAPVVQPAPTSAPAPTPSGVGGVAGVKTSGHALSAPPRSGGTTVATPVSVPVTKHPVKHAKLVKPIKIASAPPAPYVAPPAAPQSNPDRSTFADRLLSPTAIKLSAKNLGEGGMLAVLLAALLYLPVTIFNKATEKNDAIVKRWFARPRAWFAAVFGWIPFAKHPLVTLAAGVVASAGLFSFIEPGFPTEQGALQYLIGMVIGFWLVSTVFFSTWRLVLHRLEPESKGHWRLYAPFIVLAAFLVVMARLAHFIPGVVLGTVAEYEPAKKLSTRTAGIRVATTYGVLMVLGLAAWFAWIPVEHAASKEGASSLTLILDSALAITFVSSLESVAFGLIPMKFLDGNDLFTWHKGLWAAMWGAALVWFSVVILHPALSTYGQLTGTGAVWFVLLFSTLMVIALSTWAYFKLRDARLARAKESTVH